jgi:hypothetical protein
MANGATLDLQLGATKSQGGAKPPGGSRKRESGKFYCSFIELWSAVGHQDDKRRRVARFNAFYGFSFYIQKVSLKVVRFERTLNKVFDR